MKTGAVLLVFWLAPTVLWAQPEDEVAYLAELLLQASELPKRALVVGVESYDDLPDVTNATSDATRVSLALKDLQFAVTPATDLNRRQFFEHLDDFVDRSLAVSLPEQAVVVFYFSGHGFRFGDDNMLVPADAAATGESLVDKAVPLSHVVQRIVDKNVALALFFIDACRTELTSLQELELEVGFAEPLVRHNTYYGFASGYGKPSFSFVREGDANSPFARSLATRLTMPGVELHSLFEGVRQEVANLSEQRQVPHEHKDFFGDYYFALTPQHRNALRGQLSTALILAALRGPGCVRSYLASDPASEFSTAARAWLLDQNEPLKGSVHCE